MGSDLLCEYAENQTVKTMKPSVWYIEYRLKPGITWWPLDSCGPFEVEAASTTKADVSRGDGGDRVS